MHRMCWWCMVWDVANENGECLEIGKKGEDDD